jgi:hypothetical protein
MKSKYLIVESLGLELPIVFNYILDHDKVAAGMTVVAAGFCSRGQDGKFSVWGRSVGLKVGSRPEDVEILNNLLEREG